MCSTALCARGAVSDTALDEHLLDGGARSSLQGRCSGDTFARQVGPLCRDQPPYWGLRDYGLGRWEGGDAECEHAVTAEINTRPTAGQERGGDLNGAWRKTWPNNTCGLCGARQQAAGIGLESTLDEWVQNIVAVGREVWRVLRDDGTFWINIGDAYTSGNRTTFRGESKNKGQQVQDNMPRPATPEGLKAKDLMGQPWRVAFGLQDAGWYLRSAIVWKKNNPMPGSQKDRPMSSYEFIFLLSKKSKYFFDRELVREPSGAFGRDVWEFPTQGRRDAHFATFPDELPRRCILAGTSEKGVCGECGAPWVRVTHQNSPNVISNALKQYREGQGLSQQDLARVIGVTPKHIWDWEDGGHIPTGDRWQKISAAIEVGVSQRDFQALVERVNETPRQRTVPDKNVKVFNSNYRAVRRYLGWQPTCRHNTARVPAIVLDPFVGSGTTVAVAQSLGRCGIGLDLNTEYLDIAIKRITCGKYD